MTTPIPQVDALKFAGCNVPVLLAKRAKIKARV